MTALEKIRGRSPVVTVSVCLCAGILFFTAWQYIRGICNNWFTIDDYWVTNWAGGVYPVGMERLKASYRFAIDMWNQWQGCYLEGVLLVLLNPFSVEKDILRDGGRLHLFLLVVFIAFFIILGVMISRWMRVFFKTPTWQMVVAYTCLVFTLMNTAVHTQVFFWFTGVCAYTIPLMIIMLSVALIPGWKDKTYTFYLSCIGFALCCGSKLLYVAIIGWFLFMLIVALYLEKNPLWKKACLPLGIVCVCGFLNAIAPGYQFRQSPQIETGLTESVRAIYHAAGYTLFHVVDETDKIINDTPFGITALLMILLGFHIKPGRNLRKRTVYALLVMALAMPFLSLFPVLVGYGVEGLPNRVTFVLHLEILFLLMSLFLVFGTWGRRRLGEERQVKMLQILIPILVVVQITSNNLSIRRLHDEAHLIQIPVMRIYTALDKGYPQQYYANATAVAQAALTSGEEVVTVTLDHIVESEVNMEFLYAAGEEGVYIPVRDMAEYYGKKEIIVREAATE